MKLRFLIYIEVCIKTLIEDICAAAVGKMIYSSSAFEAAKDADAVLILTDWEEFAELDLAKGQEQMMQFHMGRNISFAIFTTVKAILTNE
jgi:hypothetical protein